MILPQNGRVVVIDDLASEGLPLIKVLAKKGVPTTYFTGQFDELPPVPLQDVRLVFLDIVIGTLQPDKNTISILQGILKRVIGPENSPYILVAWTGKPEYIEKIKDLPGVCPPLITLNLEKAKFKIDKENFDLGKIESSLMQELKKAGVFHLFVLWENVVHQSANQIIKEFTSFYGNDGNWHKNLSNFLFHLARAYAGKQLGSEKKDVIQNGLMTFNETFLDSLENSMRGVDYSEIDIDFSGGEEILENICAKVNSKLLLNETLGKRPTQPGNVYEIQDGNSLRVNIQELITQDLEKYPGKEEILKKLKYIELEVSPTCDFAQEKWRLSRLLPGVMWPSEQTKDVKLIKSADYIYSTPVFEKNGQPFKMVFDFRYLRTSSLENLENIPVSFTIRHKLLVDIQSHLARHINRPGVTFIEKEKKNKKKD